MNYTVTVYDSDRNVVDNQTHWFTSHFKARVTRHKLEHIYRDKDVTIEIEEVE